MRRPAIALGAVAAAGAAAIAEYVREGSALESLQAALAGVLAAAVAAYALSLPGIRMRGLLTGGFFVAAGILSWTYTDAKLVVWGFLAVEGVAFAVLSWPWLRHVRVLPRLGTAWLGLAYWVLGIAAALAVADVTIAVQRVAYLGVFTLAVLAVLASRGRELTVGIVAAFVLALAALLLAGSGNLFDVRHVVPPNDWGKSMDDRFWGGGLLLYHPNSMAGIAVAAAIRIGPDPAFTRWQRLAAVAGCGYVIFLTNSRTGFVFAVAAGLVHAGLVWWRSRGHRVEALAGDHNPWLAAATPFLILLLVLVASGGTAFFGTERYSTGGISSGRIDTWKQVVADWQHAPVAEKLLGDTSDARATVRRESSGPNIKLTTDNAAVGALRRGGVVGVLAFLVGLALLLYRAVPHRRRNPPRDTDTDTDTDDGAPDRATPGRRAPPAWFTTAVLASVPTIGTADWLLGGTGGTLWILLVAAEVAVLTGAGLAGDEPPGGSEPGA
jgi:hypothetical protein